MQTLKKVKFKTVVVTLTTRSIYRKLRIRYKGTMPLPRTMLVDDENIIIWYVRTEKLTARIVEKFIKKKSFTE